MVQFAYPLLITMVPDDGKINLDLKNMGMIYNTMWKNEIFTQDHYCHLQEKSCMTPQQSWRLAPRMLWERLWGNAGICITDLVDLALCKI